MPIRRHALGLAVLALLAACSGAPEFDETEVLGVATERQAGTTPSPAATATRAAPPATATPAAPAPTVTVAATAPAATATAVTTPAPSPLPEAGGSVTPAPSPVGTRDGPEVLGSGDGWTMNALLPDTDGEGWTEVGGPPALDRDGGSDVRLYVRLLHVPAPGDSAGRRAACETWVEAPADQPLRARGEVVVELLVGGDAVAEQRLALDVTVDAGGRHDLPGWQQQRATHAAEGQAVACAVTFTAA